MNNKGRSNTGKEYKKLATSKNIGTVFKKDLSTPFSKVLAESYKNVDNLLTESSDLIKSTNINPKLIGDPIVQRNLNRTKTLANKRTLTLNSKLLQLNKTGSNVDDNTNTLRNSDNTYTSGISELLSNSSILTGKTVTPKPSAFKKQNSKTSNKTTVTVDKSNNLKINNSDFRQRLLKIKSAINSNNKKRSSNEIKQINSKNPSGNKLPSLEKSEGENNRRNQFNPFDRRDSDNLNDLEVNMNQQTYSNLFSLNSLTNMYKNPNSNFLSVIHNLKSISDSFKNDDIINDYFTPNNNNNNNNNMLTNDNISSLSIEVQKHQLDKSLKLQNFVNEIDIVHLESNNLRNRIEEEVRNYKPVNVESLQFTSTLFNVQNIRTASNRRLDTYKTHFESCINDIKDINEILINNNNKNKQNVYSDIFINNTKNTYNKNTNFNYSDNINNENNNTTINNKINNNQNIGEINVGGINFNLNLNIIKETMPNSKVEFNKDIINKKKRKHHKNVNFHYGNKDNYPISNSPKIPKTTKNPTAMYNKVAFSKNKNPSFESDDELKEVTGGFQSFFQYADVEEEISINKPQKSQIHHVQKNNENSKILKIHNYDHYKLAQIMQPTNSLSQRAKRYSDSESEESSRGYSDEDYSDSDDPVQYSDDNCNTTSVGQFINRVLESKPDDKTKGNKGSKGGDRGDNNININKFIDSYNNNISNNKNVINNNLNISPDK